MRCHKCNQESIDIKNDHILCDICGLDIDLSVNLEEDNFFDLFFYNKNLEEAEKLGQEAILEGKELEDNPYTVAADQIILNKRWELGYSREKESYEFSALSLSSEKIENELKSKISILEREKEQQDMKINTFITVNYTNIKNFCDKLLKTKILGKFLGKRISSFKSEYKQFYRDTWDYPQ
ncbi:hypothetical protein LCGC14_2570510 [marine sediment metagenome]|uniref:Uncharacterized protein n=1 Tax=marine sediment metagenome TaxID=412755 RepID=A0A0F9DAA3_9ZZZZ